MSGASLSPPPVAPPSSPPGNEPRLFSGLRLVSICTLLSRVLGLVRDMGMAALFGNGPIMDAFSVAFRIPNLARRLFGEGALTAAFLPVFVRELEQSGRTTAWKLASAVLVRLALLLTALVLAGEAVLWALSAFTDGGFEARLLLSLTAVMLPYLVLICLAAQVSAVQHALGHFLWPALSPVVLNLVWIAALGSVLFLDSSVARIYVIAAAVLFAGLLQLLIPLPALFRLGFRFDATWQGLEGRLTEIGRAMLPILLGLSMTQINAVADSLIAWHFSAPEVPRSEPQAEAEDSASTLEYPLEPGTASALYFGQRLYQFPLGVFGVALGTVIFPLLSRHAERGRFDLLRGDLSLGLRLVLVIGVPASVGLMLMARPLTVLLFQRGAFDADDASQTAAIIAAYGLGVWAYCALPIVQRAYYAVGDRRGPLVAGLIALTLNLALNFALIWPLGGPGLALATAIAAIVQVVLTCSYLQHRIGALQWRPIVSTLAKTLAATAAMGLACAVALQQFGDSRTAGVAIPLVAAIAAYFAVARAVGLDEIRLLFHRERPDSGGGAAHRLSRSPLGKGCPAGAALRQPPASGYHPR